MSQPNQYPPQPQPGWGQQPPPGWGAPQPPRRPKKNPGEIITYVILAAVGAFAVFGVIGSSLNDSDPATASSSATTEAPAPLEEPAQDPVQEHSDKKAAKDGQYDDGDYIVGEDIPAGTYTTSGAESGLFEFCTVTTEPTSDSKFPQLKSANADERIIITLTKQDGVVTIQGCEPLTARK